MEVVGRMIFMIYRSFLLIIVTTLCLLIANIILGSQLAREANKFDLSLLGQSFIKYFWFIVVSLLIYLAGYFGDELFVLVLGNTISDIPVLKSFVSLGLVYYAYLKALEVYDKYADYTGLKQLQNRNNGESNE